MPQMTRVGTLSLDDLLRRRDISPLRFGLDVIQQVLERDLATHNRITTDIVSKYAVVSTDIRRRYGASDTIPFVKSDEFSRAHTQKTLTLGVTEFPMDGFQAAVGWTAAFFRNKTVADMAATQLAVERGHLLNIRTQLQAAFYGASNFTFYDYRDTNLPLQIKRFANADGDIIPDGPNGETFDGTTHTHYLFSAGLTAAGADALIATVLEHHQNGQPTVFINTADEAAWRALPKFQPYVDTRLSLNVAANQPNAVRLDPYRTNDKPIGLYGAAEVWLKPWALPNYALCIDLGPEAPKPLVCRVRGNTLYGDNVAAGPNPLQVSLTPVAENVLFPLQAQYIESEFGFAVWTRTNGAILYHAGGAVAYVEPAIVAQAAS
jgi:hypothetical protein